MADPDAPGAELAVAGLDFVFPGVYPEERGVRADAPVVGTLVQDVTGCQLDVSQGWHCLKIYKEMSKIIIKNKQKKQIKFRYSPWTSGGGSTFCVFSRSICSTACKNRFRIEKHTHYSHLIAFFTYRISFTCEQ